MTIEIKDQDIFIIAPGDTALSQNEAEHSTAEGGQDIIIGNTNGILYHVDVDTWKNKDREVPFGALPHLLQQMYQSRTVLAYLPFEGSSNELTGYYLANFAILNNEQPSTGSNAPPGSVYRLPQSAWFDKEQPLQHMFRPGNSMLLLELLSRGSAIAYVNKASRTMDCLCYLVNLASLNAKDVFEPTSPDNPVCEVPVEEKKPSG